MKQFKLTFDEIADFENLHAAYTKAKAGKRYRKETLRYSANLSEELIQLQNELLYGTYEVGAYRSKVIKIPKPRIIMVLKFRDRVAQWAIYRKLNPFYEKLYIHDSYGCRKEKGTVKARKRLHYWLCKVNRSDKKYFVLKLDISKYFYRIDHVILIKILQKHIKDKNILELLERIINCEDTAFGLPSGTMPTELPKEEWIYTRGMPIGNLLSQMFANIYLNELDIFCKHKLHIHHYIRYMDDVVILWPDKKELHEIKDEIERFLDEELHLNLNRKTSITPANIPVEFVGAKISCKSIKIRKSTIKRMRNNLKGIAKRYRKGEITFFKANNSVQSYFGMLKHCSNANILKRISDEFVLTRNQTT
jgi:retron-type reverse transcriptase